jgi:hypothetical protein
MGDTGDTGRRRDGRGRGIQEVLGRLEAAERAFLAREVLAPVLRGRGVGVRIAGIVCTLRVEDPAFDGWAVLRPLATDRAQIVRPARLGEMRAYLHLFPAVRLIALARHDRTWQALPASAGDSRLRIEGPVPVGLVEEGVHPFETLVARFDGRFFWYERRDGRRNPALAGYLREALGARVPPAALRRPGLSREERAAYALVHEATERAERSADDVRLAAALAHANARLLAFIERGDTFTVTYAIGTARQTSTVRKSDLTVLTAGICLAGRDRDFDLTSLVGVMRQAAGQPIPRWDVMADEEER